MPTYTIAALALDEMTLRQYYTQAKALLPGFDWTDLDAIFQIALAHRDRFPGINLQGELLPSAYMERWVKGYYEASHHLPSSKMANPKSSCTDPAIRVIVQATQNLTEQQASEGEAIHNLFMSAENIQGNLLEEYIARRTRPYGFLWCSGNVLRAIDFCASDGSLFLQIKNKSNTENSSSSNIREGTTIQKWYRLGTKSRGGMKFPDYKWDTLNELIDTYKTEGHTLPPCNMNEEDYQRFLTQVASKNQSLITDH